MQNKNIDGRPAATGGDRRRAGVARRRPQNGHPPIAPGQHMFEQPAEQLQRNVLEGQCRAMKQFQQIVRRPPMR
jgi:hypothetical protein